MLERVTKERYQKISTMLSRRQPDLSVLAENVHKTAQLVCDSQELRRGGYRGTVHAVQPTGGVPTFNETSASAEKWVELRVHASLEEARAALSEVQFLAAHFSNAAKDYRDVDYTRPTCVLLGNEKHGVSAAAADARGRAHHHPDAGDGAVLKRLGRGGGDSFRGAAAAP